MEDLVFERPRKVNQFGTYPLVAAAALVREVPDVTYELLIVAVAVPFGILAARTWGRSTRVTAEGLQIRAVRRRFIPWDQVDAITVEAGSGAGADADAGDRSIELRMVDGTRRRLPAPVERHRRSHDPEFDAKYAAIMQAWLRSSGLTTGADRTVS